MWQKRKFFQGCQIALKVQRNKVGGKIFQKKKVLLSNSFRIPSGNYFVQILAENVTGVAKTATYVSSLEGFDEKQFLKFCKRFQTSSDFAPKQITSSVEKFPSGLSQLQFARPEKNFEEKWFLFEKRSVFFKIIFRNWAIPLSFCKIH